MKNDLINKHCVPCEGGASPLTPLQAEGFLISVDKWVLSEDVKQLSRQFKFSDFKTTMMFVNAIAYVAEQEGHHPDLSVGYGYCDVVFTTHSIQGLSENDFICAAKINLLSDNME